MIVKDYYIKQLEKLNPIRYKVKDLKKLLKDKVIHLFNNEASIFFPHNLTSRPSENKKKETLLNTDYLNEYDFEIANTAFKYKIHIAIVHEIYKETNEKYKEYLKEYTDNEKIIDIRMALNKANEYKLAEIDKYKDLN
jgi:hypothetical protein